MNEQVNNYYSSDNSGVTDAQIGVDNIAGDPMLTNTTVTGANDAARGYVGSVNDATVASTIDDDILATGVTPGSFNIADMPTSTGDDNIVSTQQVNDNIVDNQDISGDSSGTGFDTTQSINLPNNAYEANSSYQQVNDNVVDDNTEPQWEDDEQDTTTMVWNPNHPKAINGYIPDWLNEGFSSFQEKMASQGI